MPRKTLHVFDLGILELIRCYYKPLDGGPRRLRDCTGVVLYVDRMAFFVYVHYPAQFGQAEEYVRYDFVGGWYLENGVRADVARGAGPDFNVHTAYGAQYTLYAAPPPAPPGSIVLIPPPVVLSLSAPAVPLETPVVIPNSIAAPISGTRKFGLLVALGDIDRLSGTPTESAGSVGAVNILELADQSATGSTGDNGGDVSIFPGGLALFIEALSHSSSSSSPGSAAPSGGPVLLIDDSHNSNDGRGAAVSQEQGEGGGSSSSGGLALFIEALSRCSSPSPQGSPVPSGGYAPFVDHATADNNNDGRGVVSQEHGQEAGSSFSGGSMVPYLPQSNSLEETSESSDPAFKLPEDSTLHSNDAESGIEGLEVGEEIELVKPSKKRKQIGDKETSTAAATPLAALVMKRPH